MVSKVLVLVWYKQPVRLNDAMSLVSAPGSVGEASGVVFNVGVFVVQLGTTSAGWGDTTTERRSHVRIFCKRLRVALAEQTSCFAVKTRMVEEQ